MSHIEIQVDGAVVFQTQESRATYNNVLVRDVEDAIPYFDNIRRRSQEAFSVMTLNGNNEVIETRIVTVGLLDSNMIHTREVFCHAITDHAAGIIVAHNHPSNTLDASPEDLAITRRLKQAGEILGIPLRDHIILTAAGFISLKQQGHL